MTPEERAVINAAIEDSRTLGGIFDTSPLRKAVNALIFACPKCNAGGHTCPGDGNPIGHADSDCGEHDDDGPREDPLSGELIPATQDAELDRRGREMAEHRRAIAEQLREIGQGTMQEWMHIVDLETPDVALTRQARVRWQNDDGECIVGESQHGEEYGAFRLTVQIEDLGPLPPIGPENDPAQIAEMAGAPECECPGTVFHSGACPVVAQRMGAQNPDYGADAPEWIARTWVDVRAGDRVRLPGTEHIAEVESVIALPWHVHPAADSYRPNEKPAEWTEIKVRLAGRPGLLSMSPAAPIEIELTASELAAIEALGWANRKSLTRS